MNMNFDHLTYEELLQDYSETFFIEFGRRKLEKIQRKIQTSKTISTLIYLSNQKRAVPNKNDFLYNLNEIPFFIFAKAETLALGGLLGLERWNQECNSRLRLANNDELKKIAIGILMDCKKTKINI
tara:strand:+ start:870 stop:1247 length:378 start_codon:yes stop_codon:yes gene_type:complete